MAAYVIYPTDEQEKFMKAFLEALEISFVKNDDADELPQHVKNGIEKGRKDIQAGRFTIFEEFKRKFPVK